MSSGSYTIQLGDRLQSAVAGRLFFILIIVVIACVYPAQKYCDNCNGQAAQECIVQKQQQICHFECDADNCGASGTCEYVCCDNPGDYYGKYNAVITKQYDPSEGGGD